MATWSPTMPVIPPGFRPLASPVDPVTYGGSINSGQASVPFARAIPPVGPEKPVGYGKIGATRNAFPVAEKPQTPQWEKVLSLVANLFFLGAGSFGAIENLRTMKTIAASSYCWVIGGILSTGLALKSLLLEK